MVLYYKSIFIIFEDCAAMKKENSDPTNSDKCFFVLLPDEIVGLELILSSQIYKILQNLLLFIYIKKKKKNTNY